jgi:hypothetical protein
MLTRTIRRQIERLGYAVRTRRTGNGAEVFAVKLGAPGERHIVPLLDPSDPEEKYRPCASWPSWWAST